MKATSTLEHVSRSAEAPPPYTQRGEESVGEAFSRSMFDIRVPSCAHLATLRVMRCAVVGAGLLICLTGCEEDQPVKAPEPVVEAATPENAAKPQPAAPAKDEAADEKAAEEAKAQAEVEANPLTECCRALGKQAFTLRSPEYHGASKACGEALTEKKSLSAVLPAIKKSLKDKALPGECSP